MAWHQVYYNSTGPFWYDDGNVYVGTIQPHLALYSTTGGFIVGTGRVLTAPALATDVLRLDDIPGGLPIHCFETVLTSWTMCLADDASDFILTLSDLGAGTALLYLDIPGDFLRMVDSSYRRYYHLAINSFNPGASGAAWVSANANHIGGWNLTATGDELEFGTDVHQDWDGATDLTVSIYFAVNVDNSGGNAGDTVDLRLQCFYNSVGETATKSQVVEVATVIGACAQYTVFKAEFTIDWNYGGNVVEVDDIIGFILNLETDTSEVDDIIILQGGASFSYQTNHIGVESGDT